MQRPLNTLGGHSRPFNIREKTIKNKKSSDFIMTSYETFLFRKR